MNRINKSISAVVLICFIFNTALSDIAFAQTFISGADADTLAVPSRLDDISGVEHKDIGDIEIWFTACITYLNEHGWEINPLNIIKFKSIESSPAGNVMGKTIFQMPGAKFLVGKMEDLGDGKLRIKVNRSGRMYYAEFSPAENGTVIVYPAGKTPARNTEDSLAIEAYKYHERLDEVIAFAHKKGLAKEPFKGNRNFKSVLRKLYETLNIEVVNPDPGNLLSIGDRNLVFIPLTAAVKEELKKRDILSKNGECPVTKIVYEGKLRDVLSYMTSSNRAIHVFVPLEIYDIVAGEANPSDGNLTRIEGYLGRHLAHEIGVMCGLTYSVNGASLKNSLDERYDSVSFNSWVIPSEKMTFTIANLDHVKGRDYATGIPVPSSDPAEGNPESQKIIRKQGKSPKDVCAVMAATRRFWYSEFSPLDYIAAYKAYASQQEGWDPDFTEEDFRKIFQANHDSFLKKGYIVTAWRDAGLRFKLTLSGRQEAGIKELADMTAAPATQTPDDDNASFECEGFTVAFNVIPDRTVDRTFPFNNKQIIDGLSRCVGSSDGNLNNIMGRGSIQSIQFSKSGEGFAAGYMIVLDKIGTKIELCVKAKGLPDNLIMGTISVAGPAEVSAAIDPIAGKTAKAIDAIGKLSRTLSEHNEDLRIDTYRIYVDTARASVSPLGILLKDKGVRYIYQELVNIESAISNMPGPSASKQKIEEAQVVCNIIKGATTELAEEFPEVLEAEPDKPQIIAPKASAPAARAAMTTIPASSGPSQSAIFAAEKSFDVLYVSAQKNGLGVISMRYLEGVINDLKAGLLDNRLEKVLGFVGRVRSDSANPACRAMASQAIADYNRITGNPTGMMRPPAPATAAQSAADALGIEIIRELRKKLEAFIAKTPTVGYRRYGEKALKATEKHERMAQGSAQEREDVYRELKELKIVLYEDYFDAQGFARARRDAIREVRDIAEDGEWAFEKYLKTIPATPNSASASQLPIAPAKAPAIRNGDGTFAREPGKSPQDAFLVIAATPKLRGDGFTIADYIEAYKIEAVKRGWDPNIAENTARNDLYVSDDSLMNTGYVELVNTRLFKERTFMLRLTYKGKEAIAKLPTAKAVPNVKPQAEQRVRPKANTEPRGAESPYFIGMSMGGTKLFVALYKNEGEVNTLVASKTIKWQEAFPQVKDPVKDVKDPKIVSPDAILDQAVNAIEIILDDNGLVPDNLNNIGCTIPGDISSDGTVIKRTFNMPFGDGSTPYLWAAKLRAGLRVGDATGVEVAHDSKISYLGETALGALSGAKNGYFVIQGSGLGGNGRNVPVEATEPGHHIVRGFDGHYRFIWNGTAEHPYEVVDNPDRINKPYQKTRSEITDILDSGKAKDGDVIWVIKGESDLEDSVAKQAIEPLLKNKTLLIQLFGGQEADYAGINSPEDITPLAMGSNQAKPEEITAARSILRYIAGETGKAMACLIAASNENHWAIDRIVIGSGMGENLGITDVGGRKLILNAKGNNSLLIGNTEGDLYYKWVQEAADAELIGIFGVKTSVPILRSPIDQETREAAGFNRRKLPEARDIQPLRNTVTPLTTPIAARVSFAPGPNDITDIEMEPNIRFMIGNIIGQYGIALKEYNFQLLEAIRTGFIATRGEALPRLEEILPSIEIGMADALYDQMVGMRAMAMIVPPHDVYESALKGHLRAIAAMMAPPNGGILAIDETPGTAGKRLEALGLDNTPENRQAMRRLLLTVADMKESGIAGVILQEETFDNVDEAGNNLVREYLIERGILSGIKVDAGLIEDPDSSGEMLPNPKGLENLPGVLAKFKAKGAVFTKWRETFTIDIAKDLPTDANIRKNAVIFAKYAKMTQEAGLVPIVEPEILLSGSYNIETSYKVSTHVFRIVFEELQKAGVWMDCMVLKPSMVISGDKTENRADSDTVGYMTLKGLLKTVPAEVPAIVFLSGGQGDDEVNLNLDAVVRASSARFEEARNEAAAELISAGNLEAAEKLSRLTQAPWQISYSFGRGLQRAGLNVWKGQSDKVAEAQAALHEATLTTQKARMGLLKQSQSPVSAAAAPVTASPDAINFVEIAPGMRSMIVGLLERNHIATSESNIRLCEAVRTGVIANRDQAVIMLSAIPEFTHVPWGGNLLYDQLLNLRYLAMVDSPALVAGSAGNSKIFAERYAELALMPGLTLFRYQESAGKPVILIRVMAPGRIGTFNFGEVTEIAAFAERNGSLKKIDVPVPCAEIIRFIRENAGDGTISVLAMKTTTTINIPSTGITVNIKDGKMNVSRGMIMGDQLNTGPVLPTPAEIMAINTGKSEPTPDAIGPDTGFTGPEVASSAVLTGDLERGKEIIRALQANLYEFIDRNQENQDATVALLAVRDGLITSMREGYNPETVYQRLYELYGEMDASGEVAGIIARNMQVFAANFTEPESVPQKMVAEEVVEATPAEEYKGVKPAQDMALPSIVPQGETGLDGILGLVPVDWIDGTLDVGTIRDTLKEAIPSDTLPVADDLWDGKLGLIFSERVTFGELLSDGSYDEGLGILLPNIVRSDVRIAVVATTGRQRALIEEINAQILDPEQKIVCGATIDEARLGLRNSARFCYFKAPGEKDAVGIPSIAIIVKRIIDAIGKVVNITNPALIEQMHEAARRFAEAA